MRPRNATALFTALLLCAALSGCSVNVSTGSSGTPTEEISGEIEEAYEEQTGLALREFSCEEIKAEEDAEIRCEGVNSSGVELLIGGKISNVEGDEFDYRWDVTRAIAPGAVYADAAVPVVERLAGEPVAGVRCEKRVEVETGRLVDCEVKTGDGEIVPIRLRLTDEDGAFDVVTDSDSDPGPSAVSGAGDGARGA